MPTYTGANSPYRGLPSKAFWRTGVAEQAPDAIEGLYEKKFGIGQVTPVATAGSCFAQHVTRQLRARNYSIIDREPAPPGLTPERAARYGYGLFSARYANIYTARQLKQIVQEAFGVFAPGDAVWEKDGRYYDAMRPSVEPEGLSTPERVAVHRAYHLARLREVIETAGVFVFTLGLTEAWVHAPSGTVYPTAPGTVAGAFNPAVHKFKNFTFAEVYRDLTDFFDIARKANPKIKFLLTVSPVPLTATASGEHVLAATVYSKSVLRAVAGQLFQRDPDVDYFPAYEIITGAQSRGAYFEDNLRSVRAEGVTAAMSAFFAAHGEHAPLPATPDTAAPKPAIARARSKADVVCEDVLLETFAK